MFATSKAVVQSVTEEKATADLFAWRRMYGAIAGFTASHAVPAPG